MPYPRDADGTMCRWHHVQMAPCADGTMHRWQWYNKNGTSLIFSWYFSEKFPKFHKKHFLFNDTWDKTHMSQIGGKNSLLGHCRIPWVLVFFPNSPSFPWRKLIIQVFPSGWKPWCRSYHRHIVVYSITTTDVRKAMYQFSIQTCSQENYVQRPNHDIRVVLAAFVLWDMLPHLSGF